MLFSVCQEYKAILFCSQHYEGIENENFEFFKYSADNFRDQYLNCLHKVPYDFELTFNGDYFLNRPA